MDFFGLLILVLLGLLLLPIIAIASTSGLKRRVSALEHEIASLTSAFAAAREATGAAPAPTPAPVVAASPPPPPVAEPAPAATTPQEDAVRDEAPPPVEPPAEPATLRPLEAPPIEAPSREPHPIPSVAPSAGPPLPVAARVSFEQRLTERWAVWLGAVALALGGVFLVRSAIDAGLLGPEVRVVFGFLLGIALALGGEAMRQRWLAAPALAALAEGFVPAAISAAGVSIAFASIFAAYALHGLLPSLVAFALLALVSLGAVALSLLQGPLIALLGLVGAYAVPLLVGSRGAGPHGLFLYMLLVTASCFAVVRHRQWWWLAWSGHAGFGLLALLWMTGAWRDASDGPYLGVYLLLYAGLVAWIATTPRFNPAVRIGRPVAPQAGITLSPFELVLWGGLVVAALLYAVLVPRADHDAMTVATFFLFCAGVMAGARSDAMFTHVPWIAAAASVFLLGTWTEPGTAEALTGVRSSSAFEILPGPPVFLAAAVAFAALFGGGGFLALAGGAVPVGWATLSAVMPLAIAVIGYMRFGKAAPDLPWSAIALAIAALDLAAAASVARRRAARGFEAALAVYAIAVIAAVGFAIAVALSLAWLTVGLAVLVAAIAVVYARIPLPALRPVACLVAAVVLVRLLANPSVLSYDLGTWPIVNGLLYTYGIPALALWYAARIFRRVASDTISDGLEAGAVALVPALGSLEIHHLMNGGVMTLPPARFVEPALLVNVWLAGSIALLLLHRAHGHGLHRKIALAALAIGAMIGAFVLLGIDNPLFERQPVGATPVLNWLLVGYALPIAALWAIARLLRTPPSSGKGDAAIADAAEAGAILLAAAFALFELHHLMNDGEIATPFRGFTEEALLVDLWLAMALGLMILYRRVGRLVLGHAAVAVALCGAGVLVTRLLLADNPLFTRVAVGEVPVFNWLLLAYAVPAVLLTAFGRLGEPLIGMQMRAACGVAALLLGLTFVTLEVRRAFHGAVIWISIFTTQPFRDDEWYAYSAAWLFYGAALLAAGIRLHLQVLRWASLAVIALAVAKVFLLDMATLTGLWRALSFLGLGGSLIALGWAYQRFVFTRAAA
jgi:uncharacterized membrane protein